METNNANTNKTIALINANSQILNFFTSFKTDGFEIVSFKNGFEMHAYWVKGTTPIDAVICVGEIMSPMGIALYQTLLQNKFLNVPFILICNYVNDNLRLICLKAGIADVYTKLPDKSEDLFSRVNFLVQNWQKINNNSRVTAKYSKYKVPLVKRAFDVFFSSIGLFALSPLFLLVIIALKLESSGPAFYFSLRAGTGYKVFKFFKFRSMFVNADQKLKDLKHLNQYNVNSDLEKKATTPIGLCTTCTNAGTRCQYPIYADKIEWCERNYLDFKQSSAKSAFVKIKNDPRVTKVGNFIRNTSIDELPQLWNVLIGDMSIVGNRPLPLYEAEKLTSDKYALRFLAPAGITGLWQVEKRGKGEMSEEERLLLDNQYAKNHSFANDIKLILKTIPALFQKENV